MVSAVCLASETLKLPFLSFLFLFCLNQLLNALNFFCFAWHWDNQAWCFSPMSGALRLEYVHFLGALGILILNVLPLDLWPFWFPNEIADFFFNMNRSKNN